MRDWLVAIMILDVRCFRCSEHLNWIYFNLVGCSGSAVMIRPWIKSAQMIETEHNRLDMKCYISVAELRVRIVNLMMWTTSQ